MNTVSLTLYKQLQLENNKLKSDNKEIKGLITKTIRKIEREKATVVPEQNIMQSNNNQIIPPFLGEMFTSIQKRFEHFKETGNQMIYTDNEIMFWISIRTQAPSIYNLMIQQFGAPSHCHIRSIQFQQIQEFTHQLQSENENKLYKVNLANKLGMQWYSQQLQKYRSRFSIMEMLKLKRIFIENQDATIAMICQLFTKQTQIKISVYTAKRILNGLNLKKNYVIDKYLDDKGGNIEFKW
ncbi:Hypothetical_protein [Hexamita inflata]|uniref:Hypothetical_protein n=1 Tax=Hexamita inflata TaxID=28002 RepID=A0ABP1HNB3_9EUKA